MDIKRRELILKVVGDDTRVMEVMYHFDHFVHAETMLEWLVKNKLTGKAFYELYLGEFKASWLSMGKWVVMKINKDKEVKALYAGKDFRVK